jgi:hypothetical protein
LLGYFNAKVAREDVSKPIIRNESLYDINNDNVNRDVNSAIPKKSVKSTTFPCHNIHKYTWISNDGKTHNQTDHILIDKRWL